MELKRTRGSQKPATAIYSQPVESSR